MKKRIVIFASGNGTNAQNIIQHFKQGSLAEVVLVLSNNANANVLERAEKLHVKTGHFSREALMDPNGVLSILKSYRPDLLVLAGFLLKFPSLILREFPHKVINIHPALLPKYGGKGMYGLRVHEAVIAGKETETGITVHYVNESYDEGTIIFQQKIALSETDTPETIAAKVHQLEYEFLPKVIEKILLSEETEKKDG